MTTTRSPAVLTPEQVTDPYREVRHRLGHTATQIFESIGFLPFPEQLDIIADDSEIKLVTGGIQGGKTHLASPILVMNYYIDLVKNPPQEREKREYWVCGHRIEDTYYEWSAIREDFKTLGLYKSEKTDPEAGNAPVIHLDDAWNTIVKIKFTADETKLSGVSPLGIVVCEGAKVSKRAFDYIIGRTLGKAAWVYISGTFEDNARPWFTAKFLEWLPGHNEENARSFALASYHNRALFPLGINDPKIKRMKAIADDDFFMERVEGQPAPPRGLVYPEFDLKIHLMHDYEYQEDERLYLWHDPGFRHHSALLFVQSYGGVLYVFDEIYVKGMTTEEVIELAQARPWWSNQDKYLVRDPWYGNRHTAVSPYSIDDIWEEKAGLTGFGDRHLIEDRIDRVKSMLRPNPMTKGPQILFHSRNCQGVLSEFGVIGRPPEGELHPYAWKVDEDGYTVGKNPIDRNNDALDALGCGLVDMFGLERHPYGSNRSDVRPVSTPESRGEYSDVPVDEYGEGEHPSVMMSVSTPESRGENVEWLW